MIYAVMGLLGLCFGSFINALVWRLHQQQTIKLKHQKASSKSLTAGQLSILTGRSMCVHCHHELAIVDLLPVISWLGLRGKCRYCHQAISLQYPLVELVTVLLFELSYVYWPQAIQGSQIAVFGLWLVLIVGLIALLIYDLRWMLLPNRLIAPLLVVATAMQLILLISSGLSWSRLVALIMALAVGGGLFYLLFQLSSGKWIGGGDVKLGLLLGLIVGSSQKSLLFIFLAALMGSLVSVPLLVSKRLSPTSRIPFGPFLISGAIIAMLFGDVIIKWYSHTFLLIG